MTLRKNEHLTREPDRLVEKLIDDTAPGMAHFAGTGPFGRSCGECDHYGYERGKKLRSVGACHEFYRMTGHHGPAFSPHTAACKHFLPRGEGEDQP